MNSRWIKILSSIGLLLSLSLVPSRSNAQVVIVPGAPIGGGPTTIPVPIDQGGTGWNGITAGGIVAGAGSVLWQQPGLGTGTSYSINVNQAMFFPDVDITLPFSSAWSFAFVIKPGYNDYDGYGTIATASSEAYGFYTKNIDTTTTNIALYLDNGETLNTTPLTIGTIYYVVITVSAANAGTIYINGAADGTFTWPEALTLDTFLTNGQFHEGLIASFVSDIAIYPTALTSGKVSTQYGLRAGAASTYRAQIVTDGANVYWPAQDDGSDFTLHDTVGTNDLVQQNNLTTLSGVIGTVLVGRGTGVNPTFSNIIGYPTLSDFPAAVNSIWNFSVNSIGTTSVLSLNPPGGYGFISITSGDTTTGMAAIAVATTDSDVTGFQINAENTSATSNGETMYGIYSYNRNRANVTVSRSINVNLLDVGNTAGGAVTDQYALKIENLTHATNNWAIYTGTGKVHFGDTVDLVGITSSTIKSSTGVIYVCTNSSGVFAATATVCGGTEALVGQIQDIGFHILTNSEYNQFLALINKGGVK